MYSNSTLPVNLFGAVYSEITGLKFYNSTESRDKITIKSANFYTLLTSLNYREGDVSNDTIEKIILGTEIGLFDHSKRTFVKKLWRDVSGGELVSLEACLNSKDGPLEPHRFVYTTDLSRRLSLLSHSLPPSPSPLSWEGHRESAVGTAASGDTSVAAADKPLRVMTYNLWHNNPPSWVYPNSK
jgi:hypothetical protein